MGEPGAPENSRSAAVVACWRLSNKLVDQAATGHICLVGKVDELDRKEVCQNVLALRPVIQHLGHLPQTTWRPHKLRPLALLG